MNDIELIVGRVKNFMPADNTCVFALAAFRETVADILDINLKHYIESGGYIRDTLHQGARSLSPEKYDILYDLCSDLLERKQGALCL